MNDSGQMNAELLLHVALRCASTQTAGTLEDVARLIDAARDTESVVEAAVTARSRLSAHPDDILLERAVLLLSSAAWGTPRTDLRT